MRPPCTRPESTSHNSPTRLVPELDKPALLAMRGVGRGEGAGEQGERRKAERGLPGGLGDGVGREVWKREPVGHELAFS